jgi:hypothetical protein
VRTGLDRRVRTGLDSVCALGSTACAHWARQRVRTDKSLSDEHIAGFEPSILMPPPSSAPPRMRRDMASDERRHAGVRASSSPKFHARGRSGRCAWNGGRPAQSRGALSSSNSNFEFKARIRMCEASRRVRDGRSSSFAIRGSAEATSPGRAQRSEHGFGGGRRRAAREAGEHRRVPRPRFVEARGGSGGGIRTLGGFELTRPSSCRSRERQRRAVLQVGARMLSWYGSPL